MARRLHKSTSDYLILALSPALIMLLIGSVVFFLVEVLYQGNYSARINYVFSLFVFATVLIGRISIEEGAERAALYAIPLGLATFIVVNTFVQHSMGLSWLFNAAILAIIWGLAHKLTWDCTVIDEREDASGEGLLQSAGFVQSSRDSEVEGAACDQEESQDENSAQRDEERTSWWKRYQQRRSRRHAPGIWVLYFSLAALPLFGLLQRTIPLGNTAARAYSFSLLIVFVASALGLLLTTAFLAIRRYLRQRQLEMPAPMAATWVVTGGVLIGTVLIFSAMLPRPAAETPLARFPFQITTEDDFQASRFAPFQEDGTEDSPTEGENENIAKTTGKTGPPSDKTPEGEQESTSRESGKNQSGSDQEGGNQQKDSQQSDSNKGKASKRKGGEENNPDSENQKSSRKKPTSQRERTEKTRKNQNDDQSKSNPIDSPQRETPKQKNPGPSESDSSSNEESEKSSSDSSGPQSKNSSKAPPKLQPPSSSRLKITPLPGSSWLGALAKLLFYSILIASAVYFLWKNRKQIRPAIAKLWLEILELWAKLWGQKSTETDDNTEASLPSAGRRPFADFADPFTTGEVNRLSPDETVRLTLEAFQAWSHEQGISCRSDQTVRELAQSASRHETGLQTESAALADLYGQVAYAPGRITREQTEPLRALWTKMRATSGKAIQASS